MLEAKPISSPMAQSTSLSTFEGDPLDDVTLYRSTVGALQYLSFTLLDISFTINQLSQYMHCPTSLHWQPVKRLLHYLKQTASWSLTQMLWFNTLQAFSGADWAGCHDDRCLTGGFCVFLGDNLISWDCKKAKDRGQVQH